jgi:hypothetical protein
VDLKEQKDEIKNMVTAIVQDNADAAEEEAEEEDGDEDDNDDEVASSKAAGKKRASAGGEGETSWQLSAELMAFLGTSESTMPFNEVGNELQAQQVPWRALGWCRCPHPGGARGSTRCCC